MATSITRNNISNGKMKNERSKIRFCKYFGLFPETILRETEKRILDLSFFRNVASGYTLC